MQLRSGASSPSRCTGYGGRQFFMMRFSLSAVAKRPVFFLVVLVLLGANQVRSERLILLDGAERDMVLAAIDGQGRLSDGQARTAPVDLFGLRTIDRQGPAAITPSPGAAALCLHGGATLIAQRVTIVGQSCLVDWQFGRQVRLPLGVVRGVVLAPAVDDRGRLKLDPSFAAALQLDAEKRDTLFAAKGDKMVTLPGLMKELGDQTLGFDREGDTETRRIPRGNLYGIVLAQVGSAPDLTGQCLVHTRDGSSLWARVAGLKEGVLRLRLGSGSAAEIAMAGRADSTTTAPATDAVSDAMTEIQLSWDAVTRVDVRSPRMVFASDLQPSAVVQEGLVVLGEPGGAGADVASAYRRDLSIAGRPLKAGTKVYEKGLGVHATCKLTYDLAGKYESFAATIALDPPVPGKGDCVFVVLADGQERLRREVKGADAPQAITVNVAGARQVTLAVLDGPDWNLAGHANWCDARFIR